METLIANVKMPPIAPNMRATHSCNDELLQNLGAEKSETFAHVLFQQFLGACFLARC